jgi:hypothetical protein
MKLNLTVLAKSDKHTGYCVAAIDARGRIIRLVRDAEGHALPEEQCQFEKLDHIVADVEYAPLKHQKENYILAELLETHKTSLSIKDLKKYLQIPPNIFSNTEPWLCEEEMRKQESTLLFVEVDNLYIYQNDEDKCKVDFMYKNEVYKGFSITDPEYKTKEKKFAKAIILVSLPDAPYKRYGHELYYKFIGAVYPLDTSEKSCEIDSYKI